MCLHLIRVCYFEKLILPGMQIIDKFFIRYCRKKTKTESDEDFSQEEENDNKNEDSHEVDQAITSSITSSVNIEPLKRNPINT
jgi:hypothetical protein